MTEMLIDLTPLVGSVALLILALVTSKVIPYLQTKMTNEQLARAKMFVEIGVYAMEKVWGSGNGEEKLDGVETFLAENGIKLDTNVLLSMVDAEIKKMELLGRAEPKLLE